MEVKHYLGLLRRWAWLLALGLVLGVVLGFVVSKLMTPVYRATTKIMVTQVSRDQTADIYGNIEQTAQALTELLVTRGVREETANRLGLDGPIPSNSIRVQRDQDQQLITITVEDTDPERAALIANTLVTVFIEQNETIQSSRFSETEEALQAQIDQIEGQMEALQNQLSQQSTESLDSQVEEVSRTISNLEAEIQTIRQDMVLLNQGGEAVYGRDLYGRRILVTPTPPIEVQQEIQAKEARLNELEGLLGMYQRIYVDLTFNPDGNNANRSDQIQAALNLYQQIYSNLLNNYESIRLARLQSTPNIIQVEQAIPVSRPTRPDLQTNLTIGGLLGLLLAGGIAFVIDYMDDTFRSPEEVTRVLKLPVMGTIGPMESNGKKHGNKRSRPFVLEQPRSPVTESFRSLRTNLEFSMVAKPLKTILVSSPGVGEGKTTIAVNLGIVMAHADKKVTILDADLRRPNVHMVMGVPNREGLSDILRDRAQLHLVSQGWQNGHISVITSGKLPPNPAEVLSSERMERVLTDLKSFADVIIVDGPPFLVADAPVLASKVDGVLLVIRLNHTQARAALAMLEQLERTGARIIGVVLNQVPQREHSYYYDGMKKYTSFSYEVDGSTTPENAK